MVLSPSAVSFSSLLMMLLLYIKNNIRKDKIDKMLNGYIAIYAFRFLIIEPR